MEMYIKNSKPTKGALRPQGLITQLRDQDIEGNPICGHLYYRMTETGRRQYGGTNTWDLWCVIPAMGYEVSNGEMVEGVTEDGTYWRFEKEEAYNPAFILGRRDGSNIGFSLRRIIAPEEQLPNGTTLPPVTVEVTSVRRTFICPERWGSGGEGDIAKGWNSLPFHQPGGKGSVEETPPTDLWERELVAYYAHHCPTEYRAAADKLAAAKEFAGLD